MFNRTEKKLLPSWLLATAIIFFIALVLLTVCFWFWEKSYDNKIYPGLSVGKIYLGGLTPKEAEKKINQQIDNFYQNGIIFNYKKKPTVFFPTTASADAELAYNLAEFDTANTVKNAMSYGREDNLLINFKNQLLSSIFWTLNCSYICPRRRCNQQNFKKGFFSI